ncbi:unnamed protein product [Caenorhabditis brenneri]
MSETSKPSIYESTFAKSDKTDAVLVVDRKKLHVNKAVLSYHSDYFDALFNSDFKEKSMEEIPIKDVNFENFATVLSLVHSTPVKYTWQQAEFMLEIADRFLFPAVKRHLELFLKTSEIEGRTLIALADKYQLEDLMDYTLSAYRSKKDFLQDGEEKSGPNMDFFNKLSESTKVKIFHRILEIDEQISEKLTVEDPFLYENTFAKSDKTDAILVIKGNKLHVNKAVLSYHSEFFNTLFNSDFKEKSMEEFEIKDVKFEDFAILLSFVQLKSIMPTDENVEKVLELADRFAIPCVKFYLEPLIIDFALDLFDDIRIGDKYGMPDLIKNGIKYIEQHEFKNLTTRPFYKDLSDDTKIQMLFKYLTL